MGRKGKKKRRKQRDAREAPKPAAAAAPADAPSPVSEPPVAGSDTTTDPPASPAEPVAAAPTPSIEATRVESPSVAAGSEDDVDAESLDDDLAADEGVSYESLIAAVAGMEDEATSAPSATNGRGRRTEDAVEDVEEVLDLDDDPAPTDGLDRLIAQVGRAAPADVRPAVEEDDVPVIDLDDEEPATPMRVRSPVPKAQAQPDLSRLAKAAAAGAVEDIEEPAVPLDLGDISTPEARARLLAEALAHAEHQEARYRVPLADTRRVARWKSVAASVLLVLAGVVAVSPPAWVRPAPPAQLSDAARARGIRLALLLQAQQVEAYRVSTQSLPASLDDLPVALTGIRYAMSGRSYQLVAFAPDGSAIVYDAADPSPAFRALEGALAPVGASP